MPQDSSETGKGSPNILAEQSGIYLNAGII